MAKWENRDYGDVGKFYPLLYLAPLILLGFSLSMFYLSSRFSQPWERILIAGCGLFFMWYVCKYIELINIIRSTIQEIAYDGSIFRGKTFGGKTFEVDKFTEISEKKSFLGKTNIPIKVLLPENSKNMIVRYNSDKYYLSGNIAGIEDLRELLYAASQRT